MKKASWTTLLILAFASCVLGNTFPARIAVDEAEFELSGEGRFSYLKFIAVCNAALYIGSDAAPGDVLNEHVPKRIEFVYLRDVPKERFIHAGDRSLRRTLTSNAYENLLPRLERINEWYKDVQKGDRYTLTYIPDIGTTLEVNGTALGTIEGNDFSSAYYSIWLGEHAVSDDLRHRLLNQNKPASN